MDYINVGSKVLNSFSKRNNNNEMLGRLTYENNELKRNSYGGNICSMDYSSRFNQFIIILILSMIGYIYFLRLEIENYKYKLKKGNKNIKKEKEKEKEEEDIF